MLAVGIEVDEVDLCGARQLREGIAAHFRFGGKLFAETAIVGTAGDLNNRLLLNGQNILLTDIMDASILSEALRGALNPDIGRTMGIEARKLYDTHLTWAVLADKFLDIMTPSVKKKHFEILTASELTPF